MSKQVVSIGNAAVSSSKVIDPRHACVFCGMDFSAETLAAAVIDPDQPFEEREISNWPGAHTALLNWLGKKKAQPERPGTARHQPSYRSTGRGMNAS